MVLKSASDEIFVVEYPESGSSLLWARPGPFVAKIEAVSDFRLLT